MSGLSYVPCCHQNAAAEGFSLSQNCCPTWSPLGYCELKEKPDRNSVTLETEVRCWLLRHLYANIRSLATIEAEQHKRRKTSHLCITYHFLPFVVKPLVPLVLRPWPSCLTLVSLSDLGTRYEFLLQGITVAELVAYVAETPLKSHILLGIPVMPKEMRQLAKTYEMGCTLAMGVFAMSTGMGLRQRIRAFKK